MRTDVKWGLIGAGGTAGVVLVASFIKKIDRRKALSLAVTGGVVGGLVGFGVERLRTPRVRGLVPYPEPKTADVYIAGTSRDRVSYKRCAMPDQPVGGKFEQWAVLVRTSDVRDLPKVSSSYDVYEKILKPLERSPQEELVAIYLNGKNNVIGTYTVVRGTADSVLVNPVDILRPGILSGATSFIVAHNHPSGDAKPSPQDAAMTSRLKDAGELIRIPLLDHLIVGNNSYSSLRDLGMM
jgi:hypothetical protein